MQNKIYCFAIFNRNCKTYFVYLQTMPDIKNISTFVAGKYTQQYQYKSFHPEPIFYDWLVDVPELTALLSDADRALGELNAFAQLVPNVDFFIQMHITKEATTSSRIEGTQTNMEEVLVKEEDIKPEKRDDWEEVHNYIKAINYSINRIEKLPISNRLIKETHAVVMRGVRGEDKNPGEYRTSQNWIGATLRDAVYVPPHHEAIADLMKDLETFLHSNEIHTPPLIRIGMIHYQFETIHPFLDGNGRMGRLLITLYLVDKGLMIKPALYISDFFEHHRTYYYDNLHRVRTHNDMVQWLKFFLVGIIETARSSIQTFKGILLLKDKIEKEVLPLFKSRQKAAMDVLTLLYKEPIIAARDIVKATQLNYSTANRMINDLVKFNVLRESGIPFGRSKVFMFHDYIKLFMSNPEYRVKEETKINH
jgi:Fic family protein